MLYRASENHQVVQNGVAGAVRSGSCNNHYIRILAYAGACDSWIGTNTGLDDTMRSSAFYFIDMLGGHNLWRFHGTVFLGIIQGWCWNWLRQHRAKTQDVCLPKPSRQSLCNLFTRWTDKITQHSSREVGEDEANLERLKLMQRHPEVFMCYFQCALRMKWEFEWIQIQTLYTLVIFKANIEHSLLRKTCKSLMSNISLRLYTSHSLLRAVVPDSGRRQIHTSHTDTANMKRVGDNCASGRKYWIKCWYIIHWLFIFKTDIYAE